MHIIINIPDGSLLPDMLGNECILPDECRPKYIHETRGTAENECLRLAHAHPTCRFFIFTADALAEARIAEVRGRSTTAAVLTPYPPPPPAPIPERPRRRRQSAIRNPQSTIP